MRINRAKLAAELARQDMNIKNLGEKSGISRATLSSIKCGKTCADNTAQRIAAALNITLESLIDQQEERT